MNLFVLVSFKDFSISQARARGQFFERSMGELQLQETKSWRITRRLFLSDTAKKNPVAGATAQGKRKVQTKTQTITQDEPELGPGCCMRGSTQLFARHAPTHGLVNFRFVPYIHIHINNGHILVAIVHEILSGCSRAQYTRT